MSKLRRRELPFRLRAEAWILERGVYYALRWVALMIVYLLTDRSILGFGVVVIVMLLMDFAEGWRHAVEKDPLL